MKKSKHIGVNYTENDRELRMKIALIKKKDDPLAVRISIGGFKTMGNMGYLTYRGDLEQVKLLLANALAGLKDVKKEPEISDDDGKKYA